MCRLTADLSHLLRWRTVSVQMKTLGILSLNVFVASLTSKSEPNLNRIFSLCINSETLCWFDTFLQDELNSDQHFSKCPSQLQRFTADESDQSINQSINQPVWSFQRLRCVSSYLCRWVSGVLGEVLRCSSAQLCSVNAAWALTPHRFYSRARSCWRCP